MGVSRRTATAACVLAVSAAVTGIALARPWEAANRSGQGPEISVSAPTVSAISTDVPDESLIVDAGAVASYEGFSEIAANHLWMLREPVTVIDDLNSQVSLVGIETPDGLPPRLVFAVAGRSAFGRDSAVGTDSVTVGGAPYGTAYVDAGPGTELRLVTSGDLAGLQLDPQTGTVLDVSGRVVLGSVSLAADGTLAYDDAAAVYPFSATVTVNGKA